MPGRCPDKMDHLLISFISLYPFYPYILLFYVSLMRMPAYPAACDHCLSCFMTVRSGSIDATTPVLNNEFFNEILAVINVYQISFRQQSKSPKMEFSNALFAHSEKILHCDYSTVHCPFDGRAFVLRPDC